MTKFPELWNALAAEFEGSDVKSRKQAGREMWYITARTCMNRLDDVLGPENWWDEYLPGEKSVLCKLTVRLPDGQELTKADAGGYAGMTDAGDDDKSGYSDAFKRAAVKFGVARYLYRDGVPIHAEPSADPEPVTVRVVPATDTVPLPQVKYETRSMDAVNREIRNRERGGIAPNDGPQFYAWIRRKDSEYPGIYRRVLEWSAQSGFPERIKHWSTTMVAQATRKAVEAIEIMNRERDEKMGLATTASASSNGRHH